MAGKKRALAAPSWFDPDAYASAYKLDAGDWLLNLNLRRWLHDEPNPETETALRKVGPVLRRSDEEQIKAMHLADRHQWASWLTRAVLEYESSGAYQKDIDRPSLPGDVQDALRGGTVPSGVRPLGLAAMYVFERELPDDVRKAGATFSPSVYNGHNSRVLSGTLDDAFERTLINPRFLLVDLTLPDDVLHADLRHYLATERRRLEKLGGPQPYREAARLKLKPHRQSLLTLAADGLLPFLDLNRWQRAESRGLSFYAVREMAGIDKSREAGLRQRVALALNQMRLHAWFARLERSATVTARGRQSTK